MICNVFVAVIAMLLATCTSLAVQYASTQHNLALAACSMSMRAVCSRLSDGDGCAVVKRESAVAERGPAVAKRVDFVGGKAGNEECKGWR